jgi:hypothetical protein
MTGFQSKRRMAMSKMKDMDYDIQELYIGGMSARAIAAELDIPITWVLGTIEGWGVADLPQGDELSPFETINS